MSKMGSLLLVSVLSACAITEAQNRIPAERPFIKRTPVAVAWARIIGQSAEGYRLERGPWIPYIDSDLKIARQSANAFDHLEYSLDANGNIVLDQNQGYGDSCVPPLVNPAQRYFFGDAFDVGLNYNDLKTVPAAAGATSTRSGFAWYDNKGVHLSNMAVFIATSENWVTNVASVNNPGVAGRQDYTGVIVSYGPDTGQGDPYFSDVDLEGTGLSWTMPADGTGGYLCMPGDFDSINDTFAIGKGQMMQWGLKDGNPAAVEDPNSWIDGFPLNGTFDGGDFMFMDFSGSGVCPAADVLGPTVCFFFQQSQAVTLAPIATTVGLGSVVSGNNGSLAADDSNPLKLCKAFVPNVGSPRVRFDSDFVSPILTPSAVSLALKARMTTGGAFKVRAFLADRTGNAFTFGLANQIVADSSIALSFNQYSGNATGVVARHVYSDGSMRSRVEIQQTGFSAVAVPCSEFEALNVTVAP